MLVYQTLNKFYSGDDQTLSTPLTSDYLNSIINQIEQNFNNLDTRLSAIESVLVNKTITVDVANITTANIDTAIIKSLNVSTETIKNSNIENLTAENISNTNLNSTKVKIEDANINDLVTENLLSNKAKINFLSLSSLNISDKYTFNPTEIDFFGTEPGIKFNIKPNSSNGIRFDFNNNFESFARFEFLNNNDKNNFIIEYNSENINDSFEIKSNIDLNINAKNINIDSNINPSNKKIEIGSVSNPFSKIVSQQFYGSYFSYNADLAELYETDYMYEPGTLLCVGAETEVTIYNPKIKKPIMGIVSDKPAIILNKSKEKNMIPIALKGRVYCKLSTDGERGDWIIPDSDLPGYCTPIKKEPKNKNLIIGILIDPKNNIIKV